MPDYIPFLKPELQLYSSVQPLKLIFWHKFPSETSFETWNVSGVGLSITQLVYDVICNVNKRMLCFPQFWTVYSKRTGLLK